MSDSGHRRILSVKDEYGLIGRESELSEIVSHSAGASVCALLVQSAPGAGVSAILRQAYDEIFNREGDTIPIYFDLRRSDRTSRSASERFLHEFLSQVVAFLRSEPRILTSHPDACELEDLSPAADSEWISQLIRACGVESGINNEAAFIARAFGAPLRASVQGLRFFVMIDGLERATLLEGGERLAETIAEIFSRGDFPYVLAGRRRFLDKLANRGGFGSPAPKRLEVGHLTFDAAGLLTERFAASTGIPVTEQSRDLIVNKMARRPVLIEALFEKAAESGIDLRGFRNVIKAYAESLLSGRIGGYYESLIGSDDVSESLVELFQAAQSGRKNTRDAGLWRSVLGAGADKRLAALEAAELLTFGAGGVKPVVDRVFEDFITIRNKLDVLGKPEEKVFSAFLSRLLKGAAESMAAHYRSAAAVGVADILEQFDCQEIPLALMDYGIYSANYKGEPYERLLSELKADIEKLKLPQVFHAEPASAFYEPISGLIEDDRAAIAFAFEHAEYEAENEVVWLAAEIDSKLEANEEVTTFWCDRLEMVAVANDISRFRIWLVAPEGFSPAAVEVLHQRHAIGSSRNQARMLASFLRSGAIEADEPAAENFEIVVPMGEDTELIAAHAVEDIARRRGFTAKQINQIKTALVEACINAAEHSLSPDRKIRIGIFSDQDSLRLVVSNRGIRFAGAKDDAGSGEERRGWGLRLMKSLMDEVRFERVDDGTRIVLVKQQVPQMA